MHDLIYKQDKNKLLSYISKTCIKWETYRNRQEVYLKTLDHREDVEEVENEDESDHEEPVEERAVVAKPATAQTHRQKQFFRVVKSKTEVVVPSNPGLRHHHQELLPTPGLARTPAWPQSRGNLEPLVGLGESSS